MKNKEELKSLFEGDQLYLGGYVKNKIDQLDEPETLSPEWIDKKSFPIIHQAREKDVVPVKDLQNIIVLKQELPVIPKFVAEFLEGKEEYMLYELLDNDFIYDSHDELARWLYNNDEDTNKEREFSLVLAQKYGYVIEKEQQYYALIKGHELLKDKGDWVVPTYWCLDTTNGNMFISDRITVLDKYLIEASKSDWNNLGINEHNADFVLVEEME